MMWTREKMTKHYFIIEENQHKRNFREQSIFFIPVIGNKPTAALCAVQNWLYVRKKETDEQFLWLFYDTDLVVGQKNAVSEPFVLFFWNCVSKMRPMRDRKRVKNINSCRPLIKRDESKCNFDHRWKTLLNVLILSAVSFEKTGQASQQCTCECRILSIPCFSSTTEGLLFV
jgi:hypothetical protein